MEIKELLKQVRAGEIELERAEELLKSFPYEDLGYAKLDHHRGLRTGFRETIFCEGKPDEYLVQIYKKFFWILYGVSVKKVFNLTSTTN